ncbi:MAG TPA: RagB/SusD family nutrient uptake outer membrane protein, partial [Puia sp.]|nr:RagB/SusD family nutrient uptake outer membrane protein [Puia sp.]
KPPIGPITPAVLGTYSGVQGVLIGAYAALDGEGTNNGGWGSAADNWVYGSVCADDAYKGSTALDQGDIVPLMQWVALPTNSYIAQKWATEYDGIQRANDVIRTMRTATGLTPADTTEFRAEALFLRGFFHFELRKMFHYPPFVDETITYNNKNFDVPNIDGSGNYIDIWPNIEADLTYAMNNLPATQPNKGQANKYAAEGFLAKALLYEGKYDQALPLFEDMVNNGVTASGAKYGLQAVYENNFNPDPSAKNSLESVFAAQMSVNDGSGPGGGKAYGDNLNFPYGAGPGACCGFFNPSQDVANAYKTDATGLPYLDGSWQNHPWVSDPNGAWTGNVDPRLDWAVGRAGIPYLDWGPMPGDSWIRSPADDGHFVPKKNVYAKSVQGTLSDNSSNWANVELDANNINLMRFSDVLLMDAECQVLGSSQNLAQAELYVNMVRSRAANPAGFVYTNGTFNATTYVYTGGSTPADKYVVAPYPLGYFTDGATAMKAIILERRMELAEEGHRFFDLARWQAGNAVYPAAGYMTTVLDNYAAQEAPVHPAQFANVSFISGKNEYYPIPQQQIDAENASGKIVLKQIPNF